MSASRTRGLIGASIGVAVLALTAACGDESSAPPAAQPTQSPTTPGTSPTATPPTPSGTPSTDCPETITAVRQAVTKATWGKGEAKSKFAPVSVTICQYDAQATGQAYATVMTKRQGAQAAALFALVNAAQPAKAKPNYCTKELGPTYVLRFTDNDRGVLSITAEAYGCRQLVATSFEGQGKPGELPAPRTVTPELIKSLGLR
ncbi:hypothetical protein FB561_0150 [Kribbella amoyensis]|uniref:LppP/LprE lipoprotein n=1 Tax=Kribbella amoyensis TaxID=996641 RepID=A0A561BJQ5_9ACTN|nr:hypothetical protein [Kribbella amoyensis]TWD79097.1 hypothetical protein FB561_0150 [Kribbella amoyensis]